MVHSMLGSFTCLWDFILTFPIYTVGQRDFQQSETVPFASFRQPVNIREQKHNLYLVFGKTEVLKISDAQ